MTDVEATYEGFIASRRSGRRNAIHEIPGDPGTQDPAELSQGLAQLSISKSERNGQITEDLKKYAGGPQITNSASSQM
uniref:cAMP-dependent protein kinase inhibitor alpha n=1 Tax=Mola mola TaxID=94237 RepID=A0A3Q3WC00_MOLML